MNYRLKILRLSILVVYSAKVGCLRLHNEWGAAQGNVTGWIYEHLPALAQHLSPEAHQPGDSNMFDMVLSILRGRMK